MTDTIELLRQEIERLRKEISDWEQAFKNQAAECLDWKHVAERLRNNLRECNTSRKRRT